ncbi:MAG: MBL fold hydrolase [Candidatus Harrisonbacteria bacterium CG10_big_fil_rev_8_21_14_0_10_45_28]|uniref:MBL fold hydrolase n=1 Tax=Candidatus Harrisonbacteria bacterium CG10_big_fil_rev_8_21_14_0_10_45_28 TaxID=1974586 RepID=A0A2H0UND3_9BACT|nr:MAG: MBL fold hydrolase [Candidatus Harrisonbacteria bacterium CG10_big_fil_rev_8_21_14_0_10_45_28]
MKLTFYGGAEAVTGSNYLLEFKDDAVAGGKRKILIDCGLHQAGKFCEESNYEPFAYDPKEVTDVFVTHAHIDHTGLLPKLVRHGFSGTVHSTPPTKDFAELLLRDSEHILGMEAERDGKPVLYEDQDIVALMNLWEGVNYHQSVNLGDPHKESTAKVTFHSAGHILGSASIEVEAEGKKILFSGDLGNEPSPLIGPAEAPTDIDYCLMESTYGDRLHEDLGRRKEILGEIISESLKDGGVLMIPAFALERTQILLLEIQDMLKKHNIPQVPIFLDSPLAIRLTEVYNRHRHYFKEELQQKYTSVESMFNFPGLRLTESTESSKGINRVAPPKIIIAGSGMSQGGRIIHHEKRYLQDAKSDLLIFGYQVSGSLGRRLLDGEKTIKILGETVPVRAKIRAIGAYSAHADQAQLLKWLKPLTKKLKKLFLVQGEIEPMTALASKIKEDFKIQAEIPKPGTSIEL